MGIAEGLCYKLSPVQDLALQSAAREMMGDDKLLELLSLPHWAFDFDGVVVDSSAVHADAFRRVFAEIGIDFSDYSAISGRPTREVFEQQLGKAGHKPRMEEVSRLVSAKQQIVIDLIARGEGLACPRGIRELLGWCNEHGKRVSLVTSATRERIIKSLEVLGLQRMFGLIVAAEDVARGKPHPEPYLAAMRMAGDIKASNYLVFEDSASGIASAKAAGMAVIHFAGGDQPLPGADAVINSFTEVLAVLEECGD
jgi:beta-phosphoglucomutase